MDWFNYPIDNRTDDQFATDLMALVKEYELIKTGGKSAFKSVEIFFSVIRPIFNKIIERGVITFDSPDSLFRELMTEYLIGIKVEKVVIKMPLSGMIWLRQDVEIPQAKKGDRFYLLSSGRIDFGYVRFNGCKVREFFPLSKPLIDLTVEQPKGFDKGFDLSKLTDKELLDLHSEAHEDALINSLMTGEKPARWTVNKHSFVIRELKKRGINHYKVLELDKLSYDIDENPSNYTLISSLFDRIKDFSVNKTILSVQGDICRSGVDMRGKININHPEYDNKFIELLKELILSGLPEGQRKKIDFVVDKDGEDDYFIPLAELRVVPLKERKVRKVKCGTFRNERLKNGNKIKSG